MRVLFCNIAWMDYYKGNDGNDQPHHGGSFVEETGDAHEKYNFDVVTLSSETTNYPDGDYCLGFVETKHTNDRSNDMHIEKIESCSGMKDENEVDDVLVIYCAKYPFSERDETYVVGWYKHATVYRSYEEMDFDGYIQSFNAIAKKEDCVLLPRASRRRMTVWGVPRKKKGVGYGFGQSNMWYASEEKAKPFVERLVRQIEEYDGENWIDMR